MSIPDAVKAVLSNTQSQSQAQNSNQAEVPVWNPQKNHWTFQGKKYACNRLTMPQVRDIAQSLGIADVPKLKKNICEAIDIKLGI